MRIGIAILVALWTCIGARGMEIPENVKSSVRNRVDNGEAVGIVVGYTDTQGVAFYGYGSTNRRGSAVPNEDTVFEIGAVTNLFTAMLLTEAVARNEVAYDDNITEHLPDGVSVRTKNDTPILVEQLSTHYSGLPRMPSNFRPESRDNPYANYGLRQMYSGLGNAYMQHEAGEAFAFSNFGVGLLGQILAHVAGEGYESLVASRLLKPLKLKDTGFSLSVEQKLRLASGHYRGRPVSNWDMNALTPAGGLRSSARDMVRFLEVNLGFHDVLFMDTILETHEIRGDAHTESVEIGLGWLIMSRMDDPKIYWHSGGTGGYQCFVGFTKEPMRGVVVMSNSSSGDIDDIALHLLNNDIPLREEDRPGR